MKKFFALLLCLSVMTVATACGSKEAPAVTPDAQVESGEMTETPADAQEETASEDVAEEETVDSGEGAVLETEEATFTGILEEKKDFMIVVSTADESASYAFTLGDGVVCDAEVGAEITVAYTGDMDVPVADMDLTATAITTAEAAQ